MKLQSNLTGTVEDQPNIQCENCGNEISKEAPVCPKCGHPNKKTKRISIVRIALGLLIAIGGIWYFAGGGLEQQTAKEMHKIENKVATDMVKQYEIAKRQGDPIQICVQAGFVTAAFLQAKDEANYQRWKKTEAEDCRKAGVPK
jgi:hypothetical protein